MTTFSQKNNLIRGSACFKIFCFSFPNGSPVDGDYWILDTDYETYSVVYSCSQVAFLKLELGWVLTRQANPSEAAVRKEDLYTQYGLIGTP